MSLSEENMNAVAQEAQMPLRWFLLRAAKADFTWDPIRQDAEYLEGIKRHAVLIASCVEARLQELYAGTPEDHA